MCSERLLMQDVKYIFWVKKWFQGHVREGLRIQGWIIFFPVTCTETCQSVYRSDGHCDFSWKRTHCVVYIQISSAMFPEKPAFCRTRFHMHCLFPHHSVLDYIFEILPSVPLALPDMGHWLQHVLVPLTTMSSVLVLHSNAMDRVPHLSSRVPQLSGTASLT